MANTEIKTLPESVKDFIKQYETLRFHEKEVCTPYYRNVKRVRAELRVLAGKGTPEELRDETLIFAKLRSFDLANAKETEIREFMMSQGLGVDCSGFVSHVFNFWLQDKYHTKLAKKIKYPKASLYRSLVRKLRAIENISADMLTNEDNSTKIELKEILPGDMIRMKGIKRGAHILIINEVHYYENQNPTEFSYVNSTPYYNKNNGLKYGTVEITDINTELKNQNWTEIDKDGKCYTLEGLLKDYEDNGLRRPKFIDIKGESQ